MKYALRQWPQSDEEHIDTKRRSFFKICFSLFSSVSLPFSFFSFFPVFLDFSVFSILTIFRQSFKHILTCFHFSLSIKWQFLIDSGFVSPMICTFVNIQWKVIEKHLVAKGLLKSCLL